MLEVLLFAWGKQKLKSIQDMGWTNLTGSFLVQDLNFTKLSFKLDKSGSSLLWAIFEGAASTVCPNNLHKYCIPVPSLFGFLYKFANVKKQSCQKECWHFGKILGHFLRCIPRVGGIGKWVNSYKCELWMIPRKKGLSLLGQKCF